jgi:hypothetical protein
MRRVDSLRFIAFSTLALLLYSATAAADCIKPAWPNLTALKDQPLQAQIDVQFAYQSRTYEFIVCQRESLAKRAGELAPSGVRQLILQDRAMEDRALAELESLSGCLAFSRRESDPELVRTSCEERIVRALRDRRQPEPQDYPELKSGQHSAHGGVWSYRALDFGRPGMCMDGACDIVLGVEVNNMTPVVLNCDVMLTAFNGEEGARRGEQVIRLNPGDSIPAARVTLRSPAENVEPDVMCAPAKPLATPLQGPANCTINWVATSFDFPTGLIRSSWESGTALLEFAVHDASGPPEALRIVHADSQIVGASAAALVNKRKFFTNCVRQPFRIRVEYRPFPCFGCVLFSSGVVTAYRDD